MNDLQDLIDQWDNGALAARAYPETFIQGFLEAARKYANALPMHAESGRVTWNVSVEGDPVEGWLISEAADG